MSRRSFPSSTGDLVRFLTTSGVIGSLLLIASGAGLQAAASPWHGTFQLVCEGAIVRDGEPRDLYMDWQVVDASWPGQAKALAPLYNRGDHVARMSVTESTPQHVSLTMQVDIGDDPWITGGAGTYTVKLMHQQGSYTGHYEGSFNGTQVTGTITCTRVPFWPELASTLQFEAGEHPRLLYRSEFLPTLKERAATEHGQKVLAHVDYLLELDDRGFSWDWFKYATSGPRTAPLYNQSMWAVGHALKFLLTDDPEELELAKHMVIEGMAERGGEAGAWGVSLQIMATAIVYDILHDHLDDDFKNDLRSFLRDPTTRGSMWGTPTHYHMMMSSAIAMAQLAIIGDPVPEPREPTAPGEARRIDPPEDFVLPTGVEAQAIVSGHMPKHIVRTGLAMDSGSDPFASVGGTQHYYPGIGQSVETGGKTMKAILLSGDATSQKYGRDFAHAPNPAIDFYGWKWPKGESYRQTRYCYAYWVHEVSEPITVIARPNYQGVTFGTAMWIAGQEVEQGEQVRLHPGLYPVSVRIPVRAQWAAPNLLIYDDEMHEAATRAWQQEHQVWTANGGTETRAISEFYHRRDYVVQGIKARMGSKGYWDELFGTTDLRHVLLPLAQAFQNMSGAAFCDKPDLRWTLPANIHAAHRFWACDWGSEFWRVLASKDMLPPAYLPALRHACDQHPHGGVALAGHGLFALLNYPWDTEVVEPEHWQLPLHYADTDKGLYVFRSGWAATDLVTTIGMQTHHIDGGAYTGHIMVNGLGKAQRRLTGAQALGSGFFINPYMGHRMVNPTLLHIGGAQADGGAKPTFTTQMDDGSGIVSMHADRFIEMKTKGKRGGIRGAPIAGLQHARSIAIDYSRKSGAPLLLATVDRVEGSGERPVYYRIRYPAGLTTKKKKKKSQGAGPRADGNTLIIPSEDVEWRIHFITPQAITLEWNKDRHFVNVSGGTEFFAIWTLRDMQDEAPAFSFEGSGLDAKASVGAQSVSFDGENIVLGKP